MLQFTLDLGDIKDEAEMERGLRVDPGWYLATCTDAYETKNSSFGLEFTLKNGQKITDFLNDPALAESDAAMRVARQHMIVAAKRLGLIGAGNMGQQVTLDWTDAIGREVVLHVKANNYKDKNTGLQVEGNPKIDFAGIYPLNHPKIPEDVRKQLGLGSPEVGPSAVPATVRTNGNGATTSTPVSSAPAANVGGFDVSDI